MMSYRGVPVEEIARLAGHASSRTTEVIYRRELRPVITTGAEVMDQTSGRSSGEEVRQLPQDDAPEVGAIATRQACRMRLPGCNTQELL